MAFMIYVALHVYLYDDDHDDVLLYDVFIP